MACCLWLAAFTGKAQDGVGFSFKSEEGQHLDVFRSGKQLARYNFVHDTSSDEKHHETYKPYLHVYNDMGTKPITKGAGGRFTHHRGIFFGYSRLEFEGKRYDRWHMKGGDQIHREFKRQKADEEEASFTSIVEWHDNKGKAFLVEDRTMRFLVPPKGCYALIEFHSRLEAPRGPVKLEGDPEHAGVQFRPANEIEKNKTVYYFPGAATDPKKDFDIPWVGETFVVGGGTYSVIMLNHVTNPKGTKFSAYRDYGRFGAYPVGEVGPDKPFELRYRWIVKSGDTLEARHIQTEWNAFNGQEGKVPDAVREVKVK